MFGTNSNNSTREAAWPTLDYIEKQLKAATDELEEDHRRASHEYAAAEDGSAEQNRAYRDRKNAHHQCMGMYRARIIVARAYAFDPAKAAQEADWRTTAHRVPIDYDGDWFYGDGERRQCERCYDQPATHVTIDAELLCGDCLPRPAAHNHASV